MRKNPRAPRTAKQPPDIRMLLTQPQNRVSADSAGVPDLRDVPMPKMDKPPVQPPITIVVGDPRCYPGEDGMGDFPTAQQTLAQVPLAPLRHSSSRPSLEACPVPVRAAPRPRRRGGAPRLRRPRRQDPGGRAEPGADAQPAPRAPRGADRSQRRAGARSHHSRRRRRSHHRRPRAPCRARRAPPP